MFQASAALTTMVNLLTILSICFAHLTLKMHIANSSLKDRRHTLPGRKIAGKKCPMPHEKEKMGHFVPANFGKSTLECPIPHENEQMGNFKASGSEACR
jgi:hypothetical protein